MIKKILVANRGEIAIRVMRSCREMEITSIAIFSEADRTAKHVLYADEAYCVGPAASKESYLNIEKIIEVAKECHADAIHPGYGFLSENATFARRCQEENIIFIGPDPETMEAMGDKISARIKMIEAGVPVVPGTQENLKSVEEAVELCNKIGYPVMLKASMGGGGKGMRLIHSAEEVEEAYTTAKSESLSSFGDDTVYLEKFVEEPHHIEFQIPGDKHGNVIHLCERECSVQRRNQKIVEETPSVFVTPELRKDMGEKAVAAAKAVNYIGAGTIEFLLLPRNEHPSASRTSDNGRSGRSGLDERADQSCRRTSAPAETERYPTARPCHRMPYLCRRHGNELHAEPRNHQTDYRTERNRCSYRQLRLRRI